jgi:hypothetical protein
MNTRVVLDSIPRYRKFVRWSSRVFVRYFIWSWCLGCATVLAVSIFHLDKRCGITIGLVMALTIWPALFGWLAVNSFGVLWHLTLVAFHAWRERDRPDFRGVLLFAAFLAMGMLFSAGAIGLLYAGLWRVFAKT